MSIPQWLYFIPSWPLNAITASRQESAGSSLYNNLLLLNFELSALSSPLWCSELCAVPPRRVSWRKLSQSIANQGAQNVVCYTLCVPTPMHTESLCSVLLLASNSCNPDLGWENGGCSKICSQSGLFVGFLSCWVSVKSHCGMWKAWTHTVPAPCLGHSWLCARENWKRWENSWMLTAPCKSLPRSSAVQQHTPRCWGELGQPGCRCKVNSKPALNRDNYLRFRYFGFVSG